MFDIIINAAVLSLTMYIVAKHEADYDFNKVIIISVGVAMCSVVVGLLVNPIVGLLVSVLATLLALRLFCYIGWKTSGIVTAIYFVVQIIIGVAFGALFSTGDEELDELDQDYLESFENQ